jgi:hypothetical protein
MCNLYWFSNTTTNYNSSNTRVRAVYSRFPTRLIVHLQFFHGNVSVTLLYRSFCFIVMWKHLFSLLRYRVILTCDNTVLHPNQFSTYSNAIFTRTRTQDNFSGLCLPFLQYTCRDKQCWCYLCSTIITF